MKPGDHPEFFRFPAPEGRSRESTLRLDREGRFWHDDALVEHPRLADALHTWISRHPDDRRYILTNGYDWTYFSVEDAPFTVRSTRVSDGQVWLHLSCGDDVVPASLSIADDGSLYATVDLKGDRYEARFSRHAQTQLEPALAERDGVVGVSCGDRFLVPAPRAEGHRAP